jgi:hypothetical protein
MNPNLIKITGLWKQRTKDNVEYLSVQIGTIKLLVFKNKNKRTSNDPDWNLFLAPVEPKEKPANSEPDEF